MNVWLDDNRDPSSRHTKAIFGSRGDEVWVKTADEAIELLKSGDVKSISLDHDLGDGRDGIAVARYIEERSSIDMPRIDVYFHTLNSVGRINMMACIRSAEINWANRQG